jgi:hypothetical protein
VVGGAWDNGSCDYGGCQWFIYLHFLESESVTSPPPEHHVESGSRCWLVVASLVAVVVDYFNSFTLKLGYQLTIAETET